MANAAELLIEHFWAKVGNSVIQGREVEWTDVLHLRYSEQMACFMILLKWPIGGPSSILTRSGKSSKTVDATHPDLGVVNAAAVLARVDEASAGATDFAGTHESD
jgi:hypothetical protein